ncbi:MAG TPA: PAS domain S-box protein [Gaiellales bacterium]|nr:PAS domain S-box protein [Gaiellales bacterium]
MTSRRLRIAALVAGLVLSAVVAVGESRTHVDHNTAAYLILGLLVGWSFMIAGQVAWLRRPTNLIGPLMCATALSWLCNGLTDWPTDAVFTVGELFASLWLGLLVHTILAYPSGRLRTPDARIVTLLVYLDTWVLSLLVLPFTEPRLDGADRHSAHNLLLVDHHHDLVRAADAVSLLVGICLIVAMLVILARRWQAAGVAAREVLAPVYLTGAVCMFVIGAVAIYSGFVERTGDIPFYVFSLSLAAIPQGFLYGLLRTQIGRSGAVRGLIAEIEASDEPQRLRAALRRALGDPTLELVYWLPEDDTYVDIEGALVARPDTGEGRALTTIERRDRRVLQMAHDASLLDDPALLGAATAAASLALRNQTLAGELRSQLREVAASEQRLSDLLEGVRLIAVSLDTGGLITYANPFLCELTGWSREELMGRDWLEVFNGTEVQFLERMANDDVLAYEENWIRTRGGEILDIAWNNTVIRDRDGRIIGATSIGEDITTRRRNERRMGFQLSLARAVARAERLEDVAEPMVEELGTTFDCWACVYWKAEPEKLVPVAVWSDGAAVADDFTQRVMASRPAGDSGLATYVRGTAEPRWDIDLDDDPVVLANPRAGHRRGSFAFPIIAAGQVDAVVQLCSDDVRGPDDEMLALLETVADRVGQLIERRRAEAAVAESEARKSAVLSSALDCIITIDSENRILEFNPAAEHTFGYPAQDVLGKDMADLLIPPELREEHRRGLQRHLEHHGGGRLIDAQVELTGMRASGEVFPIELAVTRIDTDDLPLFTAFVRDITARKHTDEELRRSRARIVNAGDEARRRLERNLHDGAQQRLVSLSLSLRLARSLAQRDPAAADEILESAGEQLSQALEELRELARGIHPAILTDRGLRPALEALATRAPLPVELADVPDQPLPAPIEAAAYYVVAEALTNVAKYANAKRATVRIMRADGQATIEVSDDGVGGADPLGGTGLRGLADRVEALDGTLAVESNGSGTCVSAVIPCA